MAAVTPLPADMASSPKFASFNIVDVNYKEVNGVGIPATILIPKDAKPGKHPLLVRWHGGCLITGHRMFGEWFPQWILDFALSKNAILITPDYRLLPEVSGLEILDDVRDLFAWIAKDLHTSLPDGVTADTDNILVTGESAGGWLCLQSALLTDSRKKIAAVISHYPMIDMRAPHYTKDFEKQIFTPPAPQMDRAVLRDYLSTMKKGETITSANPPDRVPIVISSLQQGSYGKMLGDDKALYPIEILEDGKSDVLPPTWILHGTNDSVVPVEGTERFEKAMKERSAGTPLLVTYREGEEHGFDGDESVRLETEWIKEGVEFIGRSWPKL